ncbi:MAG: tripartite tricarboxylate transporter substrate binding protein [Burkholderiales bacterium]|nr:tripartite tricarboxylate transporter substrate binding protein [Burkholderiales bacterium]
MFSRRSVVTWLVLLSAAFAPAAWGQAFPAKPVRFIVPITPGGSNDVLARLIAQKLTETWPHPVVVENRPGAGMNLGAEMVAKSAPDGHTWLLGANNLFAFNPHMGRLPFDVFKDFTPVAQVASVPFVMVVHPSVPAKSVAEFIDYARKNPGRINYASSGNGSPQQLAAELLARATGLSMQHVPYKGAVPAITDLIGGRVQLFIGAVNSLMPHVRDNKLRLIAGAGARRFAAFPELPAMAETAPGVALDVWLGVFLPGGAPRDLVNRIHGDIARALNTPDARAALAAQGIEPALATPEALAQTIREDHARWGKVIADANIKAD